MLPKLSSVIKSLESGVKSAHIVDGRVPHAVLVEILTDKGVGTWITNKMTETLTNRQINIMQTLVSMLESKEPIKITTAELAKRCEITEAAIYKHFPSKRKIYEG